MALQLSYAVRGRLSDVMAAETTALARATGRVIPRKGRKLRTRWRRRLRATGLEELATWAVGLEVEPRTGAALDKLARVKSRALLKGSRPSGVVDLIASFNEGATIQAADGGPLILPTKNTPRDVDSLGRSRPLPASRCGFDLVLVPVDMPSGPGGLLKRADTGEVYYVLIPGPIRIRPRLNLDREFDLEVATLDEELAREWEKEATKRALPGWEG